MPVQNERIEVRGDYATALAAWEAWEHGAIVSAGGGSFTAIYAVEAHPDELSHDAALTYAPRVLRGRHGAAVALVSPFGRIISDTVRIR